MPLVYQQNINEHTKIGVWQITESDSYFLQRVSFQYPISHPQKQLQHLAGRFLLTELLPDFPVEQIKVSKEGRPYLMDDALFFSIAHSKDIVAAIISNKKKVGIDIEIPSSKTIAIRDKFLTASEQAIFAELEMDQATQLTLAWSLKEAMFKWYGLGGVDFKKQMIIQRIEETQPGLFTSHATFIADKSMPLQLSSMLIEGHYLTWVIT